MIIKDKDQFSSAIRLTMDEAKVLFNALTIAKIHVGEDVMRDGAGSVDVEHMRSILSSIANQ